MLLVPGPSESSLEIGDAATEEDCFDDKIDYMTNAAKPLLQRINLKDFG
jgi:hypothetical protein